MKRWSINSFRCLNLHIIILMILSCRILDSIVMLPFCTTCSRRSWAPPIRIEVHRSKKVYFWLSFDILLSNILFLFKKLQVNHHDKLFRSAQCHQRLTLFQLFVSQRILVQPICHTVFSADPLMSTATLLIHQAYAEHKAHSAATGHHVKIWACTDRKRKSWLQKKVSIWLLEYFSEQNTYWVQFFRSRIELFCPPREHTRKARRH